jgi:replicative DNA helicase|tara:strand:+ start:995 stop:2515 length:1521 start_codon:yes stop_codon:yes gene_type:complete
MPIYSNQVEGHVLGGLLKHPDVLPEVDSFVNAADFYNDVHQTIYCILRESILNGEKIDKVLVSTKISNLGISSKDDIDIFDYVNTLSYMSIARDSVIYSCKELVKYRIRRELSETADRIKQHVTNSGNEDLDSIIASTDSIYSDKVSSYSFDDDPQNVFDDLEFKIEERGNSPTDDTGLATTYNEFNRLYGGLRDGNIYAIVSRPAQGKTTFINELCLGAAIKNDVPVLVLDTEMTTEEIQFRMAAAKTGVPLWFLETGKWRTDEAMTEKVRSYFQELKTHKYYHYHVRNKTTDEVCAMIRRWHMKYVGRGNKCVIAYDYVKLTGEKVNQNWAEHQAIGEKIDKLKRIAEEIKAPLITAMQMNRSGESFNRNSTTLVDDSSAIALSDRLQWFATFVAIFRRKTTDEIALDGDRFGTHKLIPLKTRFQGRDAAGHQDLIRRRVVESVNGRESDSEKLVNNFLNFRVENFRVKEEGSLLDIIRHEEQSFNIQNGEAPQEDFGFLSTNA